MWLLAPCQATAQQSIHWAYASYFGTGTYSLDDGGRSVLVGLSPKWEWRSSSIDASGRRTPGFEFRLPMAFGSHEFTGFSQADPGAARDISAFSVVPGVHIQFPMSERWRLKALAHLGRGAELRSSVDASIFRLGFRSELRFDAGNTTMSLVNGIERIGYSDSNSVSDAINLINTGLDFSRYLRGKKLGGEAVAIHWHAMYTSYLDSFGLDAPDASLNPETFGSEWELGVSFGKRDGQLRLGRIPFDRFGLAYRFGSHHEFSGVKFVFRSLFER